MAIVMAKILATPNVLVCLTMLGFFQIFFTIHSKELSCNEIALSSPCRVMPAAVATAEPHWHALAWETRRTVEIQFCLK